MKLHRATFRQAGKNVLTVGLEAGWFESPSGSRWKTHYLGHLKLDLDKEPDTTGHYAALAEDGPNDLRNRSSPSLISVSQFLPLDPCVTPTDFNGSP